MKRRNLSGIYIFEQFEGEEKRQPTVFEDCTEKTQDKWLDSLDNNALKNLAKQLGIVISELGDTFEIVIGHTEDDNI